MPDPTDPKQTPPGLKSLSPWDFVRQITDKINVQAFLFAIVIVVVLALVGESITAKTNPAPPPSQTPIPKTRRCTC